MRRDEDDGDGEVCQGTHDVLLIDNYDSFVFNLARYIEELGHRSAVYRHDAITLDEVRRLRPTHLIISPGPMGPQEAGISLELIRELGGEVPILGVCLGHQCIGHAHGATISRVHPVHGHVTAIYHDGGCAIFRGLESPFVATRYHSLVVVEATLPAALQPLAWSAADAKNPRLLMALAHRTLPQLGLQFHPESIGSQHGHTLLARFLELGERFQATGRWEP